MTIDQQPSDVLRDRFDRATAGWMPEPDLAAAIAGGRRSRRRRAMAYAGASLAVVAVAALAVAAPRIGHDDVPVAATPAADDGTFVPGTTIDTDLAAAVAAADPSLPAPTDVYPSDWSRDTPLPDADFADATEWQLVYDLSPQVQLLVYVGKPIPGEPAGQPVGTVVTGSNSIGDPAREVWFHSMLVAPDGHVVNVIEQVEGANPERAQRRRVLTDVQTEAIASAPGLDFPDPVDPPADPSAAP